MSDLYKGILTLSVLILLLCFVGCVITPPVTGEDGTAQTDVKTEQTTQAVTDAQTNEPVSEQSTVQTTEQITDEETTYGELHFPESGDE